ncbi:hypothetical protein ACFYUR_12430 [Micromonospora haikouensis]|uniref:hypothetical protein n=1 Tax=Micromonospora haikouensis TaxID=686309 RepID=UPI0036B7772F
MTAPVALDLPPLPPFGDPPGMPPGLGPTWQPTCPTCMGPVGSLLAGCNRPLCRRADLDYDAALERQLDS